MMHSDDEVKRLFMEALRFGSLNVIHAKRLKLGSDWQVNRIMNTNELFYVRKGGFNLVIDDNSFFIGKNQMVCIPANVYRDVYVKKDSSVELYTMQFYSEAAGTSYLNYIKRMLPVDMSEHQNEVERLFGAMVKIGEPVSHAEVFRRIGLAGELLGLFLETAKAEVKMPDKRSRIDFSKVMAYIDRFYRYDKISVAELAKLARVSEGYFRREFKKQYGISCKMYIDSMRTEGVLKMLRESDATLKSIAESFAFPDAAYLSRLIKKRTGLSPSEYRRKYGNS